MLFKPKRLSFIVSTIVGLSMVLAACAAPAASGTPAVPNTGGTPVATQAGTAPASGTSSASTAVKNPGTLIEGSPSGPESLDPSWEYDTASNDVVLNVYETLVFPDKTNPNKFLPLLATSWDVSQDGKTYTFHIRKGVTFQDGTPLTPQDVAYSFWRTMMMDRAGGPSWILLQPFFGLNVQTFQDDVVKAQYGGDFAKAVTALEQKVTYDNNAGTVTMNLAQPYGPFMQILSGSWASIMSQKWVTSHGGWDGQPADAEKYHNPSAEQDPIYNIMNGTGPYKLDRYAPGQETDLVANPNYWLKTPLWDGGPSGVAQTPRVVIKYISEWGTRFSLFKTGDLDINYVDTQYQSQVTPMVKDKCDASGNCQAMNSNGTVTWYTGPSVQNAVIFFNQKVNTTGGNQYIGSGKLDGNGIPPDFFSDVNIRKAFSECFDYNTFIQQVYNGQAIQGYGPIIKGELGFDASQPHYTYDPTQCAADFKASTLKSASGQSVWDTGSFIQYVYNAGNDQRKAAGNILAQDLLKINPKFKLQVISEPFASELKDQVAARLPIFMLGWLEDYHDPQDWVVPFLGSGGSYSGSQSFDPALQKQLDSLIAQAVTTTDATQRAQLYGQLQNLSYQNALDIFAVQPDVNVFTQSWVKGFFYNPLWGNSMFYYYSLSK
jgi:peptide/nickel transport system substrate-binding protein